MAGNTGRAAGSAAVYAQVAKMALAIAVLVWIRHAGNIRRLLSGTEPKIGADGQVSNEPFKSPIGDFYPTNPIARASKTMAECSRLRANAHKVAAE